MYEKMENEIIKSVKQREAAVSQNEIEIKLEKKKNQEEYDKFKKFSERKKKEFAEKDQELKREREALEERAKNLDEQEKSFGEKFAKIHSEALDEFNKNIVDCQAKYYERYKKLEQDYEENFDKYTQAREQHLADLQEKYLERNEELRQSHLSLITGFLKDVQDEAAKAAVQRAEVLEDLQGEFQKQADKYQTDFLARLKGMEENHQEKVREIQSHYDEYYNSFHDKLQERQREIADRFVEAERRLEEGYLKRQAELQNELQEKLDEIQQTMETKSADSLNDMAERRQKAWQEHQDKLQKSFEENDAANKKLADDLIQKHKDLVDRENEAEKLLLSNTEKESNLRIREEMLETKKQMLEDRADHIEEEIQKRIEVFKDSWESERESLEQEIKRLRGECAEEREKTSAYEELKGQLDGRSLPEALLQLKQEREAASRAVNEYKKNEASLSSQSEQRYRDTKLELDKLREKYDELVQERERDRNNILKSAGDDLEREQLKQSNRILEERLDQQTKTANIFLEQLNRFKAAYDTEQGRAARIAMIEKPIDEKLHGSLELDAEDQNSQELKWLKNIETGCENVGFQFHPRILYAFHTALKTAEWSPLAVLAGVSGTGKSELPRLYSAFGGIQHKMVAVQPNWDSQESMLGYFNSIDNIFEAQEVLRFLVQATTENKDTSPYGLGEYMNLVLLDEMNLAYVELYFAEFLSKLEARRGSEEQKIEVKIGAKLDPYRLKLGRNVLWTGTMNQDETTKALSDKVLDRSFIINFPRPQKLVSRKNLPKLVAPKDLLPYSVWDSWCVKDLESVFEEGEISPFKEMVERINQEMGTVGRAIGHRVWQSMEYYMANYPQVRSADPQERQDALNHAFEDQVVQKIMPKLRGIEYRGHGKGCLDNIGKILNEEEVTKGLLSDFRRSCESGYGQFIWNSAEYLNESGMNA